MRVTKGTRRGDFDAKARRRGAQDGEIGPLPLSFHAGRPTLGKLLKPSTLIQALAGLNAERRRR